MSIPASLTASLHGFLRSAPTPIFHAGVDRDGRRIVLHVTGDAPVKALVDGATKALAAGGSSAQVVVRQHDARTIAASRSLEELLRPFDHQANLFDPTAIVGRAQVVVGAVSEARAELRKELKGVFLDPVSRILYAVMAAGIDADRAAETILAAVDRATARTGSHFNRPPLRVLIVTELPFRPLVAVDRASRKLRPVTGKARTVRNVLAGAAAALGVGGMATVAVAQSGGPAVSGVNAKIDARGGYFKSEADSTRNFAGFVTGAVTMPLGQQFGFQVDGGAGIAGGGDLYWGGGGHLFWRDPTVGLFGVYGQYGEYKNASASRLGVEGEAYFGRFTLGGNVAYQWGNDSNKVAVDDGVVAGVNLKFYVTDNFMLKVGGGVDTSAGFARGGFEFQPGFAALPGLSIFADAGGGGNDHFYALAGIRYYFGDNKTLIRRHREDDPDSVSVTDTPTWEKKGRSGGVGGSGAGPAPT
ncbi:MAG: hypothetical protein AB7R90_09235 [Reyranellaceae bacterium]